MLYIFYVWYIEFHRIAKNSLIILMILFGVCLPSAEMNARNVFSVEYIVRFLNFFPWSISLLLLFTIDLFIIHIFAWCFIVSARSFLSVSNFSFLEHIHVAVSGLDHDDPLDLDEVKLFLCVLIYLSISALPIFDSFSSLRWK